MGNLQQFEQSENTIQALYEEAIYWHQQKQFEIAEKKYKEFLVWQSDNSDTWLKLGILYIEVEDVVFRKEDVIFELPQEIKNELLKI